VASKSFKQYLNEAGAIDFAPWHIRDPDKLRRFLEGSNGYGSKCKANKDGTVNATSSDYAPTGVYGDIGGVGEGKKVIMVKFRRAKRFQVISTQRLESIWGVPDFCEYLAINCYHLDNLEHITPEVSGEIFINTANLKELKTGPVKCDELTIGNFGNYSILKDWQEFQFKCNKVILYEAEVIKLLEHGGLLNLCRISKANGGKTQFFTTGSLAQTFPKLWQALQIVNKSNGDMLQCQDDLLEAGLKEFAKI